MANSTFSWDFSIDYKDESGASVSFAYACPYCYHDNYGVIFIGAGNLDKFDIYFATDQVCKVCREYVIVYSH